MFDDDDFDTGFEEEMTVDQNRLGGMLAYGYLLVTSAGYTTQQEGGKSC